jgi:preprotein translocase subunit SecF
MAVNHKFTEILKPGRSFDFVGTRKIWAGVSLLALLLTLVMLPLNAYVIPGRGSMLNWGVDFKGGSQITVALSKPTEAGAIRDAMSKAGFHGSEVIAVGTAGGAASRYMLRLGSVSAVSREEVAKANQALAKVGEASLKREIEWSEGGDKMYLRFDKALEPQAVEEALKSAGIQTQRVQAFGRTEENSFEATLVSLDVEVKKALEAGLGADTVKVEQVFSVGARAGEQLRNDGVKAMIYAILLIVVYIAFRFDFRYGPGTIIALLHDALLTVGAFALTYREFSLTTVAALLTIIGFSMNDTIVVFDRIRENAAKYRDRSFEKVVNLSINETLSRTILTSATVFFVTLAMNVVGTGVIRDFAFAMNVGVIVGTYSSIFIASPVLIWLTNKYGQKKPSAAARGRHSEGVV